MTGVQFYKLVFVQLIGISFRFVSNFTYTAFLLSRLSLIGLEHGLLVTKLSKETEMYRILGIFVLVSVLLSIVKYFQFVANDFNGSEDYFLSDFLQEYPLKRSIYSYFIKDYDTETSLVIIGFCIVSDVINYFVFPVVNLVIEIYTTRLLRKTLEEKLKLISNSELKKKKEDENAETIRRTICMVILNSLSNIFLKLPLVLNPIFEIIDTVLFDEITFLLPITSNENRDSYLDGIIYFCVELYGCEMLDELFNLLFLVSLSINLVFYYNFDKNFNVCFNFLFFKEKKISLQK